MAKKDSSLPIIIIIVVFALAAVVLAVVLYKTDQAGKPAAQQQIPTEKQAQQPAKQDNTNTQDRTNIVKSTSMPSLEQLVERTCSNTKFTACLKIDKNQCKAAFDAAVTSCRKNNWVPGEIRDAADRANAQRYALCLGNTFGTNLSADKPLRDKCEKILAPDIKQREAEYRRWKAARDKEKSDRELWFKNYECQRRTGKNYPCGISFK